jgi:hypothetical protein
VIDYKSTRLESRGKTPLDFNTSPNPPSTG